jgi:hypothetical protein
MNHNGAGNGESGAASNARRACRPPRQSTQRTGQRVGRQDHAATGRRTRLNRDSPTRPRSPSCRTECERANPPTQSPAQATSPAQSPSTHLPPGQGRAEPQGRAARRQAASPGQQGQPNRTAHPTDRTPNPRGYPDPPEQPGLSSPSRSSRSRLHDNEEIGTSRPTRTTRSPTTDMPRRLANLKVRSPASLRSPHRRNGRRHRVKGASRRLRRWPPLTRHHQPHVRPGPG